MLHITDREMFRAWRNNYCAYTKEESPTNAHRLLLFYAVECGLKALILRHRAKTHTGECEEATSHAHNINGLLDFLRAGAELRIRPDEIKMDSIKSVGGRIVRTVPARDINQMWRYGGNSTEPRDAIVAEKLEQIARWIIGELK